MIFLQSIFEHWSQLDAVTALLLLWGGYKGYRKGLIIEICSIFLFLFLIVLAFKSLQMGYDWAGRLPKSVPFTTYLLSFALAALAVNWIGKWLLGRLTKALFGELDKYLGILFGIFKYSVALSILFQLLTKVGIIKAEAVSASIFYPLFVKSTQLFYQLFAQLSPHFQEMIEAIEQQLQS